LIWDENKLSELPEKNRTVVIETINKYDGNLWWESKDLLYVAMFQIFEPVLMVDFSDFHVGLEELLGRPVFTHEMGLNVDGIKQEAKEAVAKIHNGESLETKQQYKDEMVMKSIDDLQLFCDENGTGIIGIEVTEYDTNNKTR